MKETILLLEEEELRRSKNVSNCIFVDLGDVSSTHTEHVVEGLNIVICADPNYSGFDLLKRSGVVLSTPEYLKYYKPYQMTAKIDNMVLSQGDIVFFEPETKQICERGNLVFRTKTGNLIYAIPYHLLICKVDSNTQEVTMLNGKVLVKRDLSLVEPEIKSDFIYIEKKFNNSRHNWCEIISVNHKEGYSGSYIQNKYYPMDYSRKELEAIKEEYIVLVKRFSSFDIQSLIKQYKYIDTLCDTHTVERENIIAYKKTANVEDENASPYGLYIKVKPDEIEEVENKSSIIILPPKSNGEHIYGTVVEIGSGVSECCIGDRIAYYKKNTQQLAGFDFIHTEWVLMTM